MNCVRAVPLSLLKDNVKHILQSFMKYVIKLYGPMFIVILLASSRIALETAEDIKTLHVS